jgi:hypothetical protein
MTAHNHTYKNAYTFPSVYATEFGDVDSLQGILSQTCPSGHVYCKGSGGTLRTWKKLNAVAANLITDTVEDIEDHIHKYQYIHIIDVADNFCYGARSSNPSVVCDVDPQYCSPILAGEYATDVEVIEADTGPGAPGMHSHTILGPYCPQVAPLTGFTICSLGHAGCRAVVGEEVYFIKNQYIGFAVDFYEGPVSEYSVSTLASGWTAELETKTPPAYIQQTWAHIRGELLSLAPSVLSQAAHGIYLGFNYGKTENYGHTQYYNPPGGATKIYLPRQFSASIGSLQPGTTYHYRALAQISGMIHVALLNGSVVLTGEYQGLPTECYFEWGETTEYGYETDPKTMQYSGDFASIVTQLDPEVTYHCRAVAWNALGGTIFGDDVEFTAQGACYGEDQSFLTLAGLPPPVFGSGAGYEYRTAKEVLEHVSKLAVGRGYGDGEGKFNYESRNAR